MTQPVELIDIAGDDIRIAQAAWFSTSKEITEKRLARVPELLAMLARERHTVPYEHTMLTFRITSDIATHIHFLKHRAGVSISSQSQRWRELKEDTYYIPDDWPADMKQPIRNVIETSFNVYHAAIDALVASGIDEARARESARFVLPYATQIRYMVTMNFHSFVHFLRLRNSPHAQKEVREIAAEMLRLVRETGKFEYSLKAWGL